MKTKQLALDALKHCNGNMNKPVQSWEWAMLKEAITVLEADLAAKVEPVAFAAQNTRSMKYAYIWHEEDDVRGWINLQHQSNDVGTFRMVPLYAAPQQSVPAGFVLVPIEPTEAMIEAGQKCPCILTGEDEMDSVEDYSAVYKAMLAAAPRPAP